MESRLRRLPQLPLRLRHGLVLLGLGLAAVSVATLATPPASAAKPAPSYSAAFKKLDRQWREFLGDQKGLAAETQVATKICQQAQDLENDPSTAPYAPLMWSRLDTHLSTAAEPVMDATRQARHTAMVKLESLDSTFTKLWAHKPAKLRVLHGGAQTVLHADDFYLAALNEVTTAIARWHKHLCASAQHHVDIANQLLPKGDDALSDGMARLKSLL